MYRPVKNDPAELGLYTAQQLQLEEVLTQAICAAVASAQAAETGVAAERQETRAFATTQTQHTRQEGYSPKTQLCLNQYPTTRARKILFYTFKNTFRHLRIQDEQR